MKWSSERGGGLLVRRRGESGNDGEVGEGLGLLADFVPFRPELVSEIGVDAGFARSRSAGRMGLLSCVTERAGLDLLYEKECNGCFDLKIKSWDLKRSDSDTVTLKDVHEKCSRNCQSRLQATDVNPEMYALVSDHP